MPSSRLSRNRDFTILWSGQVVSTIGSEVGGLAFPLLVLATTHSPAKAEIVGFANALPNLFLFLPAGALVAHELGFAQLVVVALADGCCFVFFSVAEAAALPQIVGREQLPQAIARNQARQQGAGVVSQPLGGFLFSVGRLVPFLFDAISYAVSFVSLLFVRPAFQEVRERTPTRLRDDVVEGLAWLWRERFLRTTMFLVAGTNFARAAGCGRSQWRLSSSCTSRCSSEPSAGCRPWPGRRSTSSAATATRASRIGCSAAWAASARWRAAI
jgi:hypothetical protein